MALRWLVSAAAGIGCRHTPHAPVARFRRAFLPLIALLLIAPVPGVAAAASPVIDYTIGLSARRANCYSVRISVPAPTGPTLEFAIPAWAPGYYQILHFENGISHVHASDSTGRALAVAHPSGRSWSMRVPPGMEAVALEYEVASSDKGYGFFASMLDTRSEIGYINGPSAFMYVPALLGTPVNLRLALPLTWSCATSLQAVGPASYAAPSYDALVDCPLQLGRFSSFGFEALGVPFHCVTVGDARMDRAAVANSPFGHRRSGEVLRSEATEVQELVPSSANTSRQ